MGKYKKSRVITIEELELADERLRARDALIDSVIASKDDSIVVDPVDRGRLAARLGAMGEWDWAESVARSIADEAEQKEALALLAQRLAQADLLDRAAEIAVSIGDDAEHLDAIHEKALALITIAKGYTQQSAHEQAGEMLRGALSSAHVLQPRDWVAVDCLVEIGALRLAIGDREEGRRVAKLATDQALKLIGQVDLQNQLVRLANLLIDLRCEVEARTILQHIRSPRQREELAGRLMA